MTKPVFVGILVYFGYCRRCCPCEPFWCWPGDGVRYLQGKVWYFWVVFHFHWRWANLCAIHIVFEVFVIRVVKDLGISGGCIVMWCL